MKYGRILLGLVGAGMLLANGGGCGETDNPARERQKQAVNKMADEADRAVGMPAITNFQQKKFVRDIYERTDRSTTTYAYVQGIDGRLTCLGQGIGYGVPYGTRSTPPEAQVSYGGMTPNYDATALAQPEPNGLYLPDNASASWWQMLDPDTKQIEVVYLEPNVIITPFKLKSAAVAAGC